MKLKFTMLSLMGALALTASAQTESVPANRVAFEKGPSKNWFITFKGGASIMALDANSDAKLSDRLTFTPSIAVGKWFTPYFATRFNVLGGEAITFARNVNVAKHENYFVGGRLDFMTDLMSLFSPYKEDRFFHLNPFVGLGYEYKFDSSLGLNSNHAATLTVGLQIAMRLSNRVDLVLEADAAHNSMPIIKHAYRPYTNKRRYTASAGLNFRLGKVGFTPVKPLDEALVSDLQGRINALRAENAELSKRPEKCPEVVVAPVAKPSHFLAEKSILFKHGKSNVSADQLITVFDASEFVNKHKGQLIITGYSQKSESRFAGLAEKRAQAVAKILTEQYGVPTQNITVEFKSAEEAPFDAKSAAWNRVVIIRSK